MQITIYIVGYKRPMEIFTSFSMIQLTGDINKCTDNSSSNKLAQYKKFFFQRQKMIFGHEKPKIIFWII